MRIFVHHEDTEDLICIFYADLLPPVDSKIEVGDTTYKVEQVIFKLVEKRPLESLSIPDVGTWTGWGWWPNVRVMVSQP